MSSVEEDPEMVSVEDDSEMVPIEEDPEMSDVEEFGRKLFMHCLNSFGVVKNPHVESSLFTDEIGDIVVSLQAYLREVMKPLLCRDSQIITDIIDPTKGFKALLNFLNQKFYYLTFNIFEFTFIYLAMISELIVFLNAMGIPVPFYWFPQLWCYVYNERIRQELLENGGWAMLAKVAEQRCKECKLHGEIAKGSKGVHHAFEDINLGMEIEMEFESFDKYNALEIVGLKRGIMSQDDILKVALDQILVPEASSNLLSELLSN